MKKLNALIATTAITSLCLINSAIARPPSVEHHLERLNQQLQLSTEQSEQVRQILATGKTEHDELLSSYGVDTNLRQQLHDLRQSNREEIESVLTQAQLEKFQSLGKRKHHKPNH